MADLDPGLEELAQLDVPCSPLSAAGMLVGAGINDVELRPGPHLAGTDPARAPDDVGEISADHTDMEIISEKASNGQSRVYSCSGLVVLSHESLHYEEHPDCIRRQQYGPKKSPLGYH
jgi:hypothetical protein